MWSGVRALFERQRSLLCRAALVPVFVGLCYLYGWPWLRAATMTTLIEVSRILGVPLHQTGSDLAELGGIPFQCVVACTMVDAFLGSVPLLWRTAVGLPRNLLRLAGIFAGIFVLNIVRLEAGFAGLTWGVPWWLGHECVAGLTYFGLFLFIVHQRAWSNTGQSTGPVLSAPATEGSA